MSHAEGNARIELSLETFLSDKDAKAVMAFADEKNQLRQERDELVKTLSWIHGYLGEYGMPTACEETVSEEVEKVLTKYQEQS